MIVDCYDDYEIRLKYVYNAFSKQNYDTKIILSDFNHYKKNRDITKYDKAQYIHVIKYKKNLSIMRILSHIQFSFKVMKEIKKSKPDIVYCMIPPNLLCAALSLMKRKYKIIFDVCDMWPETMPYSFNNPIFKFILKNWGDLRDKFIFKGDVIVAECNLFLERLSSGINKTTIYLCKEQIYTEAMIRQNSLAMHFLYLGSINNIIDMKGIIDFLKLLNNKHPVVLEIIGDGESRDVFLKSLQKDNIKYNFHGIIYDNDIKKEIINKCRFGMNMMKKDVFVGLTMKSIDYFSFGLPIVNNIPADTAYIIEKYRCGFNVNKNNIESITNDILTMSDADYINMSSNVMVAFEENFKICNIEDQFIEIIKNLRSI